MKVLVQVVVLLSGLLSAVSVYAESSLTCPSIASVKQYPHDHDIWPHGPWLPLYISNGELAADKDVKAFASTAMSLNRAEWSGDFSEAGHCYYGGTAQIAQTIVLARDMLKPDAGQFPQWQYLVPMKWARCVAGNEDECPFGGIGN
jgi:hypothetical protein